MTEPLHVATVVFPPPPVLFDYAAAERAYDEWGANCGPGAIAAICGLTLDEVRAAMGEEFERKRYTNPTMMWRVLDAMHDVVWRLTKPATTWPAYGLARVQWEGPWTEPGVPMPARYRRTHWVGACSLKGNTGIFDINALGNGTGWISLREWVDVIVPWIVQNTPGANGEWHLTHVVEVTKFSLKANKDSFR